MERADLVTEFEPYTFTVTPEMNERYGGSGDLVNYGLLIAHSNVTRSPSFWLPEGMAAVHAKEEVEFCSPAYVGHTFEVHWLVAQTYEKRDKFYQVKFAYITDNMRLILWREITDVYIGREKQ